MDYSSLVKYVSTSAVHNTIELIVIIIIVIIIEA